MHRWMRQRKQWPQVKAPPMERAPDSVRCGKWDLRATQNRRNRAISAQDLSVTEKQLTTCTKKRKRHASPSSSANSVVGENNIQAGHKDAKQFKSKGLDHYDLLVELCEGTLATGAFSGYPSTLGGPTAEGEREMMRQGKSIRMALDEIASCFDEEQYYKAYEKLAFGPPTGRQGFMGLSIDRRIVTAAVCNRKQVSAVVSTAVRAVVLKPRTTGLISMIIIILSRHFNAVVEVDYVEASGKQDVTPIPTDSTHRKGGRRGRRL
ncbi:hypothetical protein RHMOL_Rhmol02G0012300 [Rhododendron molle]|uniref:Uncharacterized protein n=1 Tax=Rhododendron molle TaxID=49168 RepID=A0ACC0PK69_RHOML|nr:hypothetical protein RHMOL_Rhmol02G0012300 [Rhododendron molle]